MHKKKGVIFQIGEELKVYSDIAIVKNKFILFAKCKKIYNFLAYAFKICKKMLI
jgi:hypothetical protein